MREKLSLIAVLAVVGSAAGLAHGPSGHHSHSGGQQGARDGLAYGQPGDPQRAARQIIVTMKEADGKMLFEPARIEVGKGEQIRFRLRNDGALDHEFLLGTPQEIAEHADMMKAMPDMKHDDPNSKQVAAKTSGDLLWHFTNVGEFDFACLIPGHREAGMSGKIIVK
ncbi:MAG: cupredoxin family protein [Hyphomicrobiaceae bacterium]|nr:cupredoxin family protein [Hyphomicrobiaceae bacterium]